MNGINEDECHKILYFINLTFINYIYVLMQIIKMYTAFKLLF